MRKLLLTAAIAASLVAAAKADDTRSTTFLTTRLFDKAVFYDGYNGTVFDKDLNDGILRHSNSRYAVRLTDEDIDRLGDDLTLNVTIGALCDNYDRIGDIYLAFVPKGSETYGEEEVDRIEIARFITPFMDMNKKPDEVPYTYSIPDVSHILHDARIREQFDIWLEAEVFGVPYAANQQIRGCEGRSDVFTATVDFVTGTTPMPGNTNNVLVPIFTKQPEHRGNINFNNYTEGATDTIGVTTRTFEFEVPEDVADGKITFILTNHGAAENGEEYSRRTHIVYVDGEVMMNYKPGGVSCEPYRSYNTQANGIYSSSVRPDLFWKQNSNWCPGQAVPIREIPLGAVKAGKHSIMIRVPWAKFVNQDGDFRPSIYFQGVKEGSLEAGVTQNAFRGPQADISCDGYSVSWTADEPVAEMTVHSYDGRLLYGRHNPESSLDLRRFDPGFYILTLFTADGRSTVKKIQRL